MVEILILTFSGWEVSHDLIPVGGSNAKNTATGFIEPIVAFQIETVDWFLMEARESVQEHSIGTIGSIFMDDFTFLLMFMTF